MEFRIRVVTPQQALENITLLASDVLDARQQIEQRGLTVVSIKPQQRFFTRAGGEQGSTKSGVHLHALNVELFALLKAGLSLVEALEALIEKEIHPVRTNMLTRLLSAIKSGKRFSTALEEQPEHFPPLYVGLIKASEQTSDLPSVLSRYIDYMHRGNLIRSKVISAAIYPMILLLVGSCVILFLVAYVVPRFAEVYRDTGRDLPWMSQLLLSWGQTFHAHTALILSIAAALLISLILALVRHGIAPLFSVFRQIPMIQKRMHLLELSRLYLTLGMLLEGGIAIVEAIAIVDNTVSTNGKKNLYAASTSIQEGCSLSAAFLENNLTTPISFRMLRVGEKSGQMGLMLTQAAAFYEAEISTWIERFSKAFEPILMAVIGLIVGAIVVLLYMPIFDLAGSLS